MRCGRKRAHHRDYTLRLDEVSRSILHPSIYISDYTVKNFEEKFTITPYRLTLSTLFDFLISMRNHVDKKLHFETESTLTVICCPVGRLNSDTKCTAHTICVDFMRTSKWNSSSRTNQSKLNTQRDRNARQISDPQQIMMTESAWKNDNYSLSHIYEHRISCTYIRQFAQDATNCTGSRIAVLTGWSRFWLAFWCHVPFCCSECTVQWPTTLCLDAVIFSVASPYLCWFWFF